MFAKNLSSFASILSGLAPELRDSGRSRRASFGVRSVGFALSLVLGLSLESPVAHALSFQVVSIEAVTENQSTSAALPFLSRGGEKFRNLHTGIQFPAVEGFVLVIPAFTRVLLQEADGAWVSGRLLEFAATTQSPTAFLYQHETWNPYEGDLSNLAKTSTFQGILNVLGNLFSNVLRPGVDESVYTITKAEQNAVAGPRQ